MNTTTKRITIVFGISMAVLMAASLFVPYLAPPQTTAPIRPTNTPRPTEIAPVTDFSGISFDTTYLHPTGLFTVAEPTGWVAGNTVSNTNRAQITMNNGQLQSVIETYVEQPDTPVESTAALSDYFTEDLLDQSWRSYSEWTETAREIQDDTLLMDFVLSVRNQTFVGRQVAWVEDGLIRSVRVVTPQNQTQLLHYLLENMRQSLDVKTVFTDSPFEWASYVDATDKHAIRYPGNWQVTDGGAGVPTTIVSQDNSATLLVETEDTTIADENAATAWVSALRDGIEVLSVAPIEKQDAEGFGVAYSFRTFDGAPQSGYAVLLNGTDDKLHVANLNFNEADVDLNAVDPEAAGTAFTNQLATVVQTFTVLPELELGGNEEEVAETGGVTIQTGS